MRLSSAFARETAAAPGVLVSPVRTLRDLARGPAPLWPPILAVVLAYGLSRPADFAAGLAQVEHGVLAAVGLTLQRLLRFSLLPLLAFAAAGLAVGLAARLRGAKVLLAEHAIAGVYAAVPALAIVAGWGAVRLFAPSLPRLDLPGYPGAGAWLYLPSLAVLAAHARAVWREPGRYAPLRPPRVRLDSGATGARAGSGESMADLHPDTDAASRDPRSGLVFLAVAAVGVLLVLLGVMERWNAVKPPSDGDAAPDVTFSLLDGSRVRLADLRGQVVVVDFWATWCPPCVASMPNLDRLARERAGRDFTVLAVNRDDGDAAGLVRSFLARHGLRSLNVALDGDADAARAFRVDALPTTFVIDREGRIVASHVGESSYGDLRELVEPLLAAR